MGFAKENLDFNKNEDKMKLKISKMNNILQEIYKGGEKENQETSR